MKLYADEPGSRTVRQAVSDSELIASHLIAYTETRTALARKHRLGELPEQKLRGLKEAFERDWSTLHRLPVTETTVRRAGDLAEQHGLRAYDSIHLAAAEALHAALSTTVTFACFDHQLTEAAQLLGMELLEVR